MDLFIIFIILIVVVVIFGYINVCFLKLFVIIGLMIIFLGFFLFMMGVSQFYLVLFEMEKSFVEQIDFYKVFMEGMLSFLFFVGVLYVDFRFLSSMCWLIFLFVMFGVIILIFLVGVFLFFFFNVFGIFIFFFYCLFFGVLIFFMDLIVVLGIFKQVGVFKSLEIKIVGESFFNDGIGVVVFIMIYQFV